MIYIVLLFRQNNDLDNAVQYLISQQEKMQDDQPSGPSIGKQILNNLIRLDQQQLLPGTSPSTAIDVSKDDADMQKAIQASLEDSKPQQQYDEGIALNKAIEASLQVQQKTAIQEPKDPNEKISIQFE